MAEPSAAPAAPAASAASRARASARARRLLARARAQSARMAELAGGPEQALLRPARAVSKWSAAEHLSHLVLVDRWILDGVDRARAAATDVRLPRQVTTLGKIVLWTGYIPRGRGRAPDPFHPQVASREALHAEVADVGGRLAALELRLAEVERSPYTLRHYLFGHLTLLDWLRFLGIHHHHHLKIVRDVFRAAARPA